MFCAIFNFQTRSSTIAEKVQNHTWKLLAPNLERHNQAIRTAICQQSAIPAVPDGTYDPLPAVAD